MADRTTFDQPRCQYISSAFDQEAEFANQAGYRTPSLSVEFRDSFEAISKTQHDDFIQLKISSLSTLT